MAGVAASESNDLHRQIADLKAQLLAAQKMTALGELVSTTTHEFNNVLMTIINYAKIGMRHKDMPMRDKAFDKILTASLRAEKITNSVLGLARKRGDSFAPTDLSQILEETLILLEREMNKYRIAVDRSLDDVPKVVANGNQIQQILLNLMTNARQAMPNGGRVVIRLSHDTEANMVDLTIRDSGNGIPADKLPHIFEPFFTTKKGPDASGKGGTGVGLSACHEIINAHHGKIRVQSEVGRGTAFTIRLPVVQKKKETDVQPAVQLGIPNAEAASTRNPTLRPTKQKEAANPNAPNPVIQPA